MLQTLISEAHNRLRHYREKLNLHRHEVFTKTNEYDTTALKDAVQNTVNEYKTRRHSELQAKLVNTRQYRSRNKYDTNSWVKNISDKQLTEHETTLLAKGMNYNTKDADNIDFIAELETAI